MPNTLHSRVDDMPNTLHFVDDKPNTLPDTLLGRRLRPHGGLSRLNQPPRARRGRRDRPAGRARRGNLVARRARRPP